jgi:hypothetical protein
MNTIRTSSLPKKRGTTTLCDLNQPPFSCGCAEAIALFPGILEDVAKGAAFMLVNAGPDSVRFVRFDPPPSSNTSTEAAQRTGFMKGSIPSGFDTLFSEEIQGMFNNG